jgi:hypothetical protein
MSPDAEKLYTQYENGRMAAWTYARALLVSPGTGRVRHVRNIYKYSLSAR